MRNMILTALYMLCLPVVSTLPAQAQVGIGTTTPNPRALLDVFYGGQGGAQSILFPRVTTAQRDDPNFAPFPAGAVIYNTTTNCLEYFNGTDWICAGAQVTNVTELTEITNITQVTNIFNDQGIPMEISAILPASLVYEVLPAAMGVLNGLPTLQQRVGNRYWRTSEADAMLVSYANAPKASTMLTGDGLMPDRKTFAADAIPVLSLAPTRQATSDAVIEQNAIWTRIEAAHGSYQPTSSTLTSYDVDHWQLRAGIDAQLMESDAGRLIAGVNAALGNAGLDAKSVVGTGTINTTGSALAATLTWYGEKGFYADVQAQYSWFENDLQADTLGVLVNELDGNGTALSLELGQRLSYSDTLTFIPQAQLSWSQVEFDTFTGPRGEVVSMGEDESIVGRIGLAIEHADSRVTDDGAINRRSIYGIANVMHDFASARTVDVSGVTLTSDTDDWTGELGLGGTLNWKDDRYSLYGETSYLTDLTGAGDGYSIQGNLGFRMKW